VLGLFKKTNEQLAVAELKRLRVRIKEAGGPEQLCYRYWKFVESNELHRKLGVAPADEAPIPAMMATLSALDLLNSWKSTPDTVGENIKELMELLAQRVYVASLLSLSNEQLATLYKEVGGESATGTAAREATEARLQAEVASRKSHALASWSKWKAEGFNVLEAIRKA
jgi:hypothetical protein